jgi:membrane-bound ClpP family serine protease
VLTIVVVGVVSLISLVFSLRAKTWNRFALKQNIDSTSMPQPEQELSVGVVGVAISRLAPMGKVMVNSEDYEAKVRNGFVDGGVAVVVVAVEGNVLVVEPK